MGLRLTVGHLRALGDDELEPAIFDNDSHDAPEACGDVHLMCVVIEGEIYNGGFSQFFWNSTKEYLDDSIAAYEKFGMSEMAELMRDAKKFYRAERRTLERLQRQRRHEAYIEWTERPGIRELERRFSELEPTLRPARVKYIRAHLQLFASS